MKVAPLAEWLQRYRKIIKGVFFIPDVPVTAGVRGLLNKLLTVDMSDAHARTHAAFQTCRYGMNWGRTETLGQT